MTREEELKALAHRLIDWNRRYPKSALNAPRETVNASELELDDIVSDFESAVRGTVGVGI